MNRFIFFAGLLAVTGCSLFPTRISEPVYLNTPPKVSVRYEFNTAVIIIPVKILEGEPKAYKVSLYARNRMAEPMMERMFFPADSLKMELPKEIWNQAEMGNVATVIPLGDDFNTVDQMFNIREPGRYVLGPVTVRKTPAVLIGHVLLRHSNMPVKGASLSIKDSLKIIGQTQSDSLGFFRLELPHKYQGSTGLSLQTSTNQRFPDQLQPLDFSDQTKISIVVQLGVSESFASSGNLYRVIQDFTPFRQGPENGSPIIMMLQKGDMFIGRKRAGERIYGEIEVIDEVRGIHEKFSGWVLDQYLELTD